MKKRIRCNSLVVSENQFSGGALIQKGFIELKTTIFFKLSELLKKTISIKNCLRIFFMIFVVVVLGSFLLVNDKTPFLCLSHLSSLKVELSVAQEQIALLLQKVQALENQKIFQIANEIPVPKKSTISSISDFLVTSYKLIAKPFDGILTTSIPTKSLVSVQVEKMVVPSMNEVDSTIVLSQLYDFFKFYAETSRFFVLLFSLFGFVPIFVIQYNINLYLTKVEVMIKNQSLASSGCPHNKEIFEKQLFELKVLGQKIHKFLPFAIPIAPLSIFLGFLTVFNPMKAFSQDFQQSEASFLPSISPSQVLLPASPTPLLLPSSPTPSQQTVFGNPNPLSRSGNRSLSEDYGESSNPFQRLGVNGGTISYRTGEQELEHAKLEATEKTRRFEIQTRGDVEKAKIQGEVNIVLSNNNGLCVTNLVELQKANGAVFVELQKASVTVVNRLSDTYESLSTQSSNSSEAARRDTQEQHNREVEHERQVQVEIRENMQREREHERKVAEDNRVTSTNEARRQEERNDTILNKSIEVSNENASRTFDLFKLHQEREHAKSWTGFFDSCTSNFNSAGTSAISFLKNGSKIAAVASITIAAVGIVGTAIRKSL